MRLLLPNNVEYILNTLDEHGFDAYVVGGAVRDSILNRKVKDWDIATSAHPEDVIAIFDHTIPTGIKHGTVSVMVDHIPYEVTTFRADGNYSDGRHPDSVDFVSDIRFDLERRDFTINALAYGKNGLIDLFGGLDDLREGTIRCIGNPNDRFQEDALRILRAFRFGSELDFSIDIECGGRCGRMRFRVKFIVWIEIMEYY